MQNPVIVERRPLKDQIYEYITSIIQNGDVQPGEKLTEQRICDSLGVSRTPVREAMTQLADEGVIEKKPRRGFFVKTFSQKEQDDFYQVMFALEFYAATLYMKICTEAQLQQQERYVQAMWSALRAKQFETYIQTNAALHLYVVDQCGNALLAQTVHQLFHSPIPTYYVERSDAILSVLEQSIREHEEMIACIRQKDRAGLEAVYRKHWLGTRTD